MLTIKSEMEKLDANYYDSLSVDKEVGMLYLRIHISHNATATLCAVTFRGEAVSVNLGNLSMISARNCFALRVFASEYKMSIAIASRGRVAENN